MVGAEGTEWSDRGEETEEVREGIFVLPPTLLTPHIYTVKLVFFTLPY